MNKEELIKKLNSDLLKERIDAIRQLKTLVDSGAISAPEREGYTNNHMHTKFSFSPYTPAEAVWKAYMSGLEIVGIIDHDSVGGAEEFTQAGEILGIATTVGFEMRTDWSGTKLAGRRINNPDQTGSAYICAHGLPRINYESADKFLSSIRNARSKRNRAMTERLNYIMRIYGISLDYDADVLPLSYASCGGEVTERHLLFALAQNMIKRVGKGQALIDFLSDKLDAPLSGKQLTYLLDTESSIYDYDVLNVLKSSFIQSIYIDTNPEEAPPVKEAVAHIKALGAIPTYCYLGDVGASPTGDKKEQKFEDDYLEEVFIECRDIGFDAIAIMPSRNTREQLERVMALCDKYGFLQISGEDINQPRQSLVCTQLKEQHFAHLIDAAWALVGHESSSAQDITKGMFADGAELSPEAIREKIAKYRLIGLEK